MSPPPPKSHAERLSYVSKGIQVVVGEFELLEGHQLPHPVGSCGWGVGVHIQPARHGRLGLPSHHPENRGDRWHHPGTAWMWKSFLSLESSQQPSCQPWGDAAGHGNSGRLLPLMVVFGILVLVSQAGRVTPSLLPQRISLRQCLLHMGIVETLFKEEKTCLGFSSLQRPFCKGRWPCTGESTGGQEQGWLTLPRQAGLPQPVPGGRGWFPLWSCSQHPSAAPLAPHHQQLSWTQGPAMRHHLMATPSLLHIVLLL